MSYTVELYGIDLGQVHTDDPVGWIRANGAPYEVLAHSSSSGEAFRSWLAGALGPDRAGRVLDGSDGHGDEDRPTVGSIRREELDAVQDALAVDDEHGWAVLLRRSARWAARDGVDLVAVYS